MDLRQLRYFCAIVEEGSLTRAALRLGVAQPALSLHIRKMEDEMGTALLLRGASGVTPTEAGLLLVARAGPLLAGMRSLEDDVRASGGQPSGEVRLGLPGTISVILSVPLIARVRREHPRIKVIVVEAMSGFIRDWLREGRVDLAVLYGQNDEAGLRATDLLQEELALIGPPGAVLDRAGFALLAQVPLILPSGAHGLRRMIEQHLRRAQIAAEPEIEVDSYPCIKRLVADGYGYSVLPFHAVAAEAHAGTLAIGRLRAPELWRNAQLVRNAARPVGRAADCVEALLRDEVGRLIDSGEWAGAVRGGGSVGNPS